jgi:hypothetical protein
MKAKNLKLHTPGKRTQAYAMYKQQQADLIAIRLKHRGDRIKYDLVAPYRDNLPMVRAEALDAGHHLKSFTSKKTLTTECGDLVRSVDLQMRSNRKIKTLLSHFEDASFDSSGDRVDKNGLQAALHQFLPGVTINHQVMHYITHNMVLAGGEKGKYNFSSFEHFLQRELQRQHDKVDAGNKRKSKLAEKFQALPQTGDNSKYTASMRRRIELNEQYYTRPHGRLSEFGGLMSRAALPAKANVEENPDLDFVDAESLTTLNSETASLRSNVDKMKDQLQLQV